MLLTVILLCSQCTRRFSSADSAADNIPYAESAADSVISMLTVHTAVQWLLTPAAVVAAPGRGGWHMASPIGFHKGLGAALYPLGAG